MTFISLKVEAGLRLRCVTALGLTVFAGGCRSGPDAEDARIAGMAQAVGHDPVAAVQLERANEEFYENRPTDDLFRKVEEATRSPQVSTRVEAYTTLASLRATPYHDRSLKVIERMAKDSSPEVADRFVWVAYLAEHPRWRQLCQEAAQSSRSESRRLASQALALGPRTPKRTSYRPE